MEYSYNHVINCTQNKVKEQIEKYQNLLKKDEETLRNVKQGKEEIDFPTKLGIKLAEKRYKKKIEELAKLSRIFNNMYHIDIAKVQFLEQGKEELEDLMSVVSKEQADEIRKIASASIRKTQTETRKKIQDSAENAKKITEELSMGNSEVILSDGHYNKYDSITFSDSITKIEQTMLQSLESSHISFTREETQPKKINIMQDVLIGNIEEMISKRQFNDSKSTKEFVSNFSKIKEALYERENCSNILLKTALVKSKISKSVGVDLATLLEYIEKIEGEISKKKEKVDKYLEKFDFANIERQVDENYHKEQQENKKQGEIMQYKQAAYDLEKAKTNNPEDYQQIMQKEEQLRAIARTSSMSNLETEDAYREGISKFKEDESLKQAQIESKRARYAEVEALEKELAQALRKEAERELEQSGAFMPQYEVKNGDVYNRTDREALITAKMKELRELAEMTPEQRGLQDLKQRGRIAPDATFDSLNPSLKNDIRIGYSNSSYEFMDSYKKTNEAKKERANSIYKEYVLYRTKLKDKSERLAFADYAKQFYEINGITDELVSDEIKQEGDDLVNNVR